MKKVLIFFVFLLVILVAGIAIAPQVVDWNSYKDLVAEQVKQRTGRDLVFAGDVGISLFPAPAFVAEDVSLSNVPGAATKDMVHLKKLELEIAPGPLLGGQLHFQTVRLVDPVIELEVMADGNGNWSMHPMAGMSDSDAESKPSKPVETNGKLAVNDVLAVRFDDIAVENATVVVRNSQTGWMETIEGLYAGFGSRFAGWSLRKQWCLCRQGNRVRLRYRGG